MFTTHSFAKRAQAPLLGTTLNDRFVINGLLGVGGYGAVYQAWDPTFREQVAIKVLNAQGASTDQSRRRFLQEARLLRRLKSQHVVRVSDFGTLDDGMQFMIMDWVPGRPMSDLYSQQPRPSIARMLGLLDQVLAALIDVHAEGLVHRDLKPANIIVGERGGHDWITLIDFGIAKGEIDAAQHEQPNTRTGVALGTLRYMAPEQFGRGPEVSARTDVYAAGIMLYQILAGRSPFNGSPMEMAAGHLRDPVPPLPSSTPPALAQTVHAALVKHPADRLPDAATMRAMLCAARPHPAVAMPRVGATARPSVSLRSVSMGTTAESMGEVAPPAQQTGGRWVGWLAMGALLVGGAVGGWLALDVEPTAPSTDAELTQRISLNARPMPIADDGSTGENSEVDMSATAAPGAVDATAPDARPPHRKRPAAPATGHDSGAGTEKPRTPTGRGQRTERSRSPGHRRDPSAPSSPRPPPGEPAPPTPDAIQQARIAEIEQAASSCRCDSAKTLLRAMAAPPMALSARVGQCEIPDFDQVCRDGRAIDADP